jgi:hypothetical protein
MLTKMHQAKGKAAYRTIVTEVEAKANYFVAALNALNN